MPTDPISFKDFNINFFYKLLANMKPINILFFTPKRFHTKMVSLLKIQNGKRQSCYANSMCETAFYIISYVNCICIPYNVYITYLKYLYAITMGIWIHLVLGLLNCGIIRTYIRYPVMKKNGSTRFMHVNRKSGPIV